MKMLGYKKKLYQTKFQNLKVKFYQRMTMFQLFQMSRLRNKKMFVSWALIGAVAAYRNFPRRHLNIYKYYLVPQHAIRH